MSKSAINKQITITAGYVPISATPLLYKGSVSNYSTHTIYVLGTDENGAAADVPAFPPNFTQDYSAVDLSTLQVKGTAADKLTLVGEEVDPHRPNG